MNCCGAPGFYSATWDHWIIDEQTQYYMIVHYTTTTSTNNKNSENNIHIAHYIEHYRYQYHSISDTSISLLSPSGDHCHDCASAAWALPLAPIAELPGTVMGRASLANWLVIPKQNWVLGIFHGFHIPWRIHGAGIYSNIKGVYFDGKCYHIYIYIPYMDPMGMVSWLIKTLRTHRIHLILT